MRTSDFHFELPPDCIAQSPVDRRDHSRLLRLDRETGGTSDHVFRDLPHLLRPGDVLVLNDTLVIPARFTARRQTGRRIDGLFLRELSPGRWECMLKNAGRCRPRETLLLDGLDDATVTLAENLSGGNWRVDVTPPLQAVELLERIGRTPLPPYIRRDDDQPAPADDPHRYQTVYARRPGAVAAPTAGLHFTPELFSRLAGRGVETARLTLHVGPGTFAPVKVDDPTAHDMHAEWYDLPGETADTLNRARSEGRRIVAVGTTAVRVLETVASDAPPEGPTLSPASGWTDIFLYPPADFHAVDALITNFHLPESTLVMLVAAFCAPGRTEGRDTILAAYAHAIDAGYRFYSYGDAMLIE